LIEFDIISFPEKSMKKIILLSAIVVSLLVPVVIVRAESPEVTKTLPNVKNSIRNGAPKIEKNPVDPTAAANLKEKIQEKIKSLIGTHAAIRNGKLTTIDGTKLTIEGDGKTYSVLTGTFTKCTTQFRRRYWGKSSLAEFTVGDMLSIAGRWQDNAKTTIEACVVRDSSIQKMNGTFVGEIVSFTDTGFVMTTLSDKRANQTVTLSTTTKLVNRKMASLTKNDMKVGHRIRVKGLWNRTDNTITEVTQVKDFTLPIEPKPTGAQPTATPVMSPAPTATP